MKYIDMSTLTARPFSEVFTAGRKLAILLAAAVLLPALVAAQTTTGTTQPEGSWNLADVAARALEADPALRSSRALAGIASTQYELEIDKARPKLDLELTPFSWDDRRLYDFTEGPSATYEDSRTLSLGGGLNLSQALPTAGVLSAGAKTLFKVTDPTDDIGYALAPSFSASLPSAFTDFFDYGGGAGVNWNLSLSFDIPLTARAAREYGSRLDSLALDAAESQLTRTERSVADRAAALTERRDALDERLAIQRRIAALETRKADRLDDLAAAGTVSLEDAADARAELDRDLATALASGY